MMLSFNTKYGWAVYNMAASMTDGKRCVCFNRGGVNKDIILRQRTRWQSSFLLHVGDLSITQIDRQLDNYSTPICYENI